MAQYYTDFGSYPVGGALGGLDTWVNRSDWDSDPWNAASVSNIDAAYTGSKYVYLAKTFGTHQEPWSWGKAGSPGDVELYTRVKRLGGNLNIDLGRFYVRGQGTGSGKTAYFTRFFIDSAGTTIAAECYRLVAGAYTLIATKNLSASAFLNVRMRITGSGPVTVQWKAWEGAPGDEPTAWDHDATDASPITAAGWVGLSNYHTGGAPTGHLAVDIFSVGTAGDSALPDPPLGNQPPTAPGAFTLPENGGEVESVVPLEWGVSTDPEDDPIQYEGEVSINGGAYASAFPLQTGTSYTYSFSGLAAGTTLKFRVRAHDGTSYGPYTESGTVTVVAPNAPQIVQAILQQNGDVLLVATPWTAAGTHIDSTWQVQLAGGDWTSLVFESVDDTVNLTSITVPAAALSAVPHEARVTYTVDA